MSDSPTGATVFGAPEGYDALLLARRRAEHKGTVLHVARDDARMARLTEALAFFAPNLEVLRFPAWDCLPYDRVSPNAEIVSERIATLARLLDPGAKPRLVLTTVNALVQRVPPRSAFDGRALTLRAGGTADPAAIAAFLESNGYTRAGTVMEPGEYASRGSILDIFPAGEAEPVRLDLFGDEIESLRHFDTTTQRSTGKRNELVLRPVSEVPLDKASITRFREQWRDLFGPSSVEDPLYQTISDGRKHPGIEHWVSMFHETMETLLDYLPNPSVSLDHQAQESLDARLEMIADHEEARRTPGRDGEVPYRPLPARDLYLDRPEWDALLAGGQAVSFSPYGKPEGAAGVDAGGRPGAIFTKAGAGASGTAFGQLKEQATNWITQKRRTVVAAWSKGARERLLHLLRENGVKAEAVETWKSIQDLPLATVGVVALGLERGFTAAAFGLVAEQDLLGERISRPPRRKKSADQFIAEATEIAAGDLIVHQDYGIGRYDGLETLRVGPAPHDCLRLIYDNNEKLYLPVENIELLSRFGSEEGGAALDKLGGAGWQTRKAKMKQRIRDMAGELIRTAAARKVRQAATIAPPEGAWDEFCGRFPFAETEDQERAIADVLEDMAAGRPMDRLICGDVGFGKTEVALRAAFVAAMSGGQVAVVVPTTLLARQHTRAFTARFQGFPIKVAQLSRMVTAKEAAEVKKGLADGSIGVVVGTHALVSKGITFSNLELLIVDEEQHFGVSHKEKLKQIKDDVHVLTLTATPIPRTLQLALTGVREMSLIATPPVDRLAVRTFISQFDSVMVREAILRERFRGGQIFCVVPRLDDMAKMHDRLRGIVPEARIVEAHGRLSPTELERVMTEFGDGKHDILLATNIVESGLDMPAVNTLIIYRADMFGLGALYQLRGRVGRGKQRGYAYLTWPVNQRLSPAAEKRLDVMQTLDTLGAGFTLASHDLDIRGAGNLLGDEQSGNIREVGIELYQQMLEDAVADLQVDKHRQKSDREWTPNIQLGLPVLIPDTYVADLPVRLGLYRRIGALASNAETDAMAAELIDRFGPLPPEVANLLEVVTLKRMCRESGVEKLEAGPKGMVVAFRGNQFRNPAGLINWVTKRKDRIRLRPDHKLSVVQDMPVRERMRIGRDVLTNLTRLAAEATAKAA